MVRGSGGARTTVVVAAAAASVIFLHILRKALLHLSYFISEAVR